MLFEFLEGRLFEEAGDSGGGLAVADASSDFATDTSDAGSDAGGEEVHDAEFVEPSQDLATVDKGAIKPGERAVMNGKLTPSGKAAIESLRTLSPKLAQEVTQSLLTRDWFLKEFPGGKAELAQLRELAKSNGGEQGISELKKTASFFNELDELFSASDPKFFDQITTTEEEKAALVGMMGPALAKFAQLSPTVFAHHQAKNFLHLMQTGGLPTSFATQAAILNRAGKALTAGNSELAASFLTEITENHNQFADFFNKIYDQANKTPESINRQRDPALDDRSKQLTLREQALQKQEWESAVRDQRKQVFGKAWAEQTKGRNLTGDQDSTVKGFYELRMATKIKQWQNQAERFFANGDKDGYLREQFAFFQKAIPEAVRQALQQGLPGKPGPKGGPVKPPVNVPRNGPQNGAAIKVQRMPSTSELDPVRTTSAMLSANQAYRKDGKLVQWA